MADMHPAATRYLNELDRALRALPRDRRKEIVEEITDHIREGAGDAAGEAEIRTLLDDLGDPEAIAADARDRFGVTTKKAGGLEGAAISALLVGGVVIPAVGWVVGVVLLWISRVWTTRDKLIGTFVVPGGLALPLFLYVLSPVTLWDCETIPQRGGGRRLVDTVEACSGHSIMSEWWGVALLIPIAMLPIATAIYLGRRAWRTT